MIKVDEEKCIGCGLCQSICPSVFKIEDNKSKVVSQEAEGCNLQDAIDSCPQGAISQE